MNWKKAVLLLLAVASPIVIYLLWPSDEARIRKLIKETAGYAEAGDVQGVMQGVSFNYKDSQGLSYLVLKRILEREFKVVSQVEVEVEALRVEVLGDKRARASFDMLVLANYGGERGYYLGAPGRPFAMSIELEKSSTGRWVVAEAKYDIR